MIRATLVRLALAAFALVSAATAVGAQPLGTFSWQLAPYCNVVTVNVTQTGSTYTLDGYDTQCGGASNRAPVTGMAVPNPNGTIGLGFTIVTSPNGTPVHVDASLTLTALGGTWRDSLGHDGTFIFTPAGVASGNPRPLVTVAVPDGSITTAKLADGAVTASKIDASSVQQRVQGTCPAGQLMTGVNQNGTVSCQAVSSGSGGDITAVTAGVGLTGGGQTGAVTLNVAFAGTGSSPLAARADHAHAFGSDLSNTAVGDDVLDLTNLGSLNTAIGKSALTANTNGSSGTAVGYRALFANTAGNENTAIGMNTLVNNTSGGNNTAVGARALGANVTGSDNTAVGQQAGVQGGTGNTVVGSSALRQGSGVGNVDVTAVGFEALLTSDGEHNTAVGATSLRNLTVGNRNIAIGSGAGANLTSGNDNIYLGNPGVLGDDGTVRIGRAQTTRAFVEGVRGVTTGANNAVTVVIDSNGQLGTVSSSRRTKFDIREIDPLATTALHRLRPVQFRYRQAFADGSAPVQYGLIAEEVQDVIPDLVATDSDGAPATVKYHVLPGLLLADVQRLERERQAQQLEIAVLRSELAALRARLDGAPAVSPR